MRLRISHSTTYQYDPPATGVIQVLRMTPGNHDGQYVANWQVDVTTDAKLVMHHDAFGNITHTFTHGTVSDLTVHVAGQVETQDTGGILRGSVERFPPSLFLRTTPLTGADTAMRKMAAQMHEESEGNALDFLHGLLLQLNEYMAFDPDPTNTGTSAIEAFTLRRGVCQDYAHTFIALARAVGVPARFVSGHFYREDADMAQEAGHAWAEAYVSGLGWVGFDPANGISPTDAHVRVAIGLDYLGAAPVRGTRYGGGAETLSVAVQVDQARRQSQN